MNKWITALIGLSLVSILVLSAVWRHYVYAPTQTQADFDRLIQDAKPILKQRKKNNRINIATSITTLLDTPQVDETDDKKAERLAAKKRLDAAIEKENENKRRVEYEDFKTSLKALEPRFAGLNHNHLTPCQSNDAYRYWGALRLWQSWVEKNLSFAGESVSKIAEYETRGAEYMGRPVSFSDIKNIGEEEYAAVKSQLEELEIIVQSDFNLSLDDFATRAENYSQTEEDILGRTVPLLRRIEEKFTALDDFGFAPVPTAAVQTQQGYGPAYAIASYNKNHDAMRVYWTYGRYNHMYDTMLIIHEIMPGHHLHMKMQKQRACGQGPVPSRTAFLEGWATYAELLAEERGLFDDPLQRLGWLDYRLVRAMRILMDTARVEQGLSKDEIWNLWQEKMPRRLDDDFPREWARINNSPHHLSYIFGSQAILTARNSLRKQYGPDFDEVEFHAALLNAPHQSLMFLTERIDAQIRARDALNLILLEADQAAL